MNGSLTSILASVSHRRVGRTSKPQPVRCVSFQMRPNPKRPIRTGRRRSPGPAAPAPASSPGSSCWPCWACGRRWPWFTLTWSTTRELWVSAAQQNQNQHQNRHQHQQQNQQQHFDWTSVGQSKCCFFWILATVDTVDSLKTSNT